MPSTTSLKLSDNLRSNKVYRATDVKAYIMTRIGGGKPARPDPVPLKPAEPMAPP